MSDRQNCGAIPMQVLTDIQSVYSVLKPTTYILWVTHACILIIYIIFTVTTDIFTN